MQTAEYPMWTPHPKAKLYKRYTGELSTGLEGAEVTVNGQNMGGGVITAQGNRYVHSGNIKWIEETTEEKQDELPIGGFVMENSYLTIKTNSLKEIKTGDIIELPKGTKFAGFWIIVDGSSVDYAYTPKQVQTFQHLPLSSLG